MEKNSFNYYLEMIKTKEVPEWEDNEVQKVSKELKRKLLKIENNNEIEKFIKQFEDQWNSGLDENVIKDAPLEISFRNNNQWRITVGSLISSPSMGKSHYYHAKGNITGEDFTKYNNLLKKENKTSEEATFIKEFPNRQKADYKDAKRRHTLLMGLITAVLEIQKTKENFWIQLKNEDYNKYNGQEAIFKIKKFQK